MFMRKRRILITALGALALTACSDESGAATGEQFPELGSPAPHELIAAWDTDVRYDGAGLPPGEGTYDQGARVYTEQCAACHGEALRGVEGVQGGPLIGEGPTVTQHWPYAPTFFDYVRRAMPFNAPGSLSDNEIYSLAVYIFAEGGIYPADQPMNAAALTAMEMPNKDNFVPDPRPDVK